MSVGRRDSDLVVQLLLAALLGLLAVGCGSSAAAPGDDSGTPDSAGPTCGNGVLEEGEDCDDGNRDNGDGCQSDCTFTCIIGTYGDARCDDKEPCNGAETCGPGNFCVAGTPLADGADCGEGRVCVGGICQLPSCGDGQLQPDEECDDGNAASGDGCEPDCKLTCLSTDSTRNCASSNACQADGTCNDTTHTCAAGANQPDGTACGSGQICLAGACGASVCGDGYVDTGLGEECEDGNLVAGDGCEPGTCTWSCSDPATDCQPPGLCQKVACDADHTCAYSADLAQNGDTCGNGLICADGDCVTPPQVCGNGVLESPEECDDDNQTPGDGCEPVTCQYSCHNPASDCPAPPVCNAAACADVIVASVKVGQKCATVYANEGGSPTGCATPNTCHNGACVPPTSQCGNGVTEAGEDCDYGTGFNGPGTGCESNCKFTCAKSPDNCPDTNVCNGVETCGDVTVNGRTGQKCSAGTPATDGTGCGGSNICLAGQCVLSQCGDGFTDTVHGEQCDFGAGFNLAGSGCEPNCHFSCAKSPDSCPDANACNGAESCGNVTVNGHPGQKCSPGTPLAVGTSCGAGNLICVGDPRVCASSSCGDGYVNPVTLEECEPPSTSTCDASCKLRPVCGDNTLQTGEQCDDNDGTPANLDGCDTNCKYEAMIRMTDLQISGGQAPTGCTPRTNRFGTQVIANGTVLGELNTSLRTEVVDGSVNIVVQMLGLDDLTGVADSSLQLGLMSGVPDPARGAWPGTGVNDQPLDWWFLIDPNTVDSNTLLPTARFSTAAIAARQLSAGPDNVVISLALGGSPAALQMRTAHLYATVNNSPAPNRPAAPPTLLAAGTTMFQTVSASASGKGLCGNITVESLSLIPVPQVVVDNCVSSCGRTYTYCGADQPVGPGCNSLLDAIVGGCSTRFIICVGVLNATQPDVDLNGNSPAARTLTLGAGNKVPTNQTIGNLDGYSSFFTFAANRAHATGLQP
jgi:cysteine-rich repeat protein